MSMSPIARSPRTPQTDRSTSFGLGLVSKSSPSPMMNSPVYEDTSLMSALSNSHEKSNIQVVCRLRPLSVVEEANGCSAAVKAVDDSTVSIEDREADTYYTFDHVCDIDASQKDVYELVGKQILDDLFAGLNGTILAYGQTGAGKSFTMFGDVTGELENRGIIPRIASDIFRHISEGSADVEYTVGVSMMEIYKEHIIDLLNPRTKDRDFVIHQNPANGIYVKGLTHAFVSSPDEMDQFFQHGYLHRKKGSTIRNAESSRSHAIFQVTLSQHNTTSGEMRKSNLFLVDLAGSEKVDRASFSGNIMDEAKKINKSLSTLGLVINSLTDPKSTFVPYRDSKLTRILQESLGGNSRTTLIINISQASNCVTESLSTLRFGKRAKKIQNHIHINTELGVEQLKARVSQLEKLVQSLEHQLKEKSSFSGTNSGSRAQKFETIVSPNRLDVSPSHSEDLLRKDAKIAQLEQELLESKMSNLKMEHNEDSNLFKLESSLHQINDKLKDVELMNENLRRHLLISEKVIRARDEKIEKLSAIVSDQQAQVNRESSHFEAKLRLLRSKLDAQRFREASKLTDDVNYNELQFSESLNLSSDISMSPRILSSFEANSEYPYKDSMHNSAAVISPISPKTGLNLRIVKPVRGGQSIVTREET